MLRKHPRAHRKVPTEEEKGRDSRAVRRERRKTAKLETLADLAKRRYEITKTAAHRALLLRKIRIWSTLIAAALMAGLGAWSAVGVHTAVSAGEERWSVEWLLGWLLEPMLLMAVAAIVVVRSYLALAGARLNRSIWGVEVGLLALSVAANVKALPIDPALSDYVLRLTGPLGCILVSIVLAAVDAAIERADIHLSTGVDTPTADSLTGTVRAVSTRAFDMIRTAFTVHADSVRADSGQPAADTADTPRRADTPAVDSRTAADADSGQRTLSTPVSVPVNSADTADSPSVDTPVQVNADTADTRLTLSAGVASTVRGAVSTQASTVRADTADTPATVRADSSAWTADTVHADADSAADTDADSPMDTAADSVRADSGQPAADTEATVRALPTDTHETETVQFPKVSEPAPDNVHRITKKAEALAAARQLGPEYVLNLSVRKLALEIGCAKTMAGKVQTEIKDEHEQQQSAEAAAN